ncbi:MAG: YihY/virulence factor BrkB family protein [Roseinatronobacter sp.]
MAKFEFALEFYNAVNARNTGLLAAGVAFFALLAVFPAIAAFISVFGVFSDPNVLNDQLSLWQDLIPPAAYTLMSNQINRLIWANEGVLGWAGLASALIALFLARRGVDAMLIGLCAIHRTPRRKGLAHAASVAFITFGMLLVGVVALLSFFVVPIILQFLPLGNAQAILVEISRWVLSLGLVALWIWVFYRIGPNRKADQIWIWKPGLVLAMVIWISASAGFSYYISNFGDYNEIYGSIGAVIALLMWLYISAYSVLLGAVLNATLEQRAKLPAQAESRLHDVIPKSDETAQQATE